MSLSGHTFVDAVLDSWGRNGLIPINLLRAVPREALDAKASQHSPTISQMFAHIHYVRLAFVTEDAPEFASELRYNDWMNESDPQRLEQLLVQSAAAVQNAVADRLRSGREMDMHYDHPVLFLQHMIWHEGYHHGQIKLVLKLAGFPLADEQAGPLTWSLWTRKRSPAAL